MSLTVYSERPFTSVSSTWQDIKGAMTKQLTHAPTKRTPASHTRHWVDTRLQRLQDERTALITRINKPRILSTGTDISDGGNRHIKT